MKMLLLPLLLGVLLFLNGTQSMVLKSVTTKSNLDQEFQDYVNDENDIEDTIKVKDVNLAAADFEDERTLEKVDVNIDQPFIEAPTTKKTFPITELSHTPLPPQQYVQENGNNKITAMPQNDFIFAAVVSACSVALLAGLIMTGVCWYKLNKKINSAIDADYPAYGVTGPTKERLLSLGDRKLAQSAQMYHYQHQKQQMIAMEKANGEVKRDPSEDESDEENEEGDYTVYECPGLAPTGEMEVRNPLFTGDVLTPVNGKIPEPGLRDTSHDQHK